MATEKYNHFSYGLMLATKLKAIKHIDDNDCHFFRATAQDELKELEDRISQAHDVILIAIDGTDSDFDWKNSDSLIEQPSYLFAVVQETDSSDTDSVFKALTHCKVIGHQIMSKMLQDRSKYKSGLDYLEPSSYRMKGFGPIGDNFYGVLLSFLFEKGIEYKINKEMWED